jgi:predicted outer membrane repeat protein
VKNRKYHFNELLPFLIHIRTAWDDYFTGSPTLIQSKEYGTGQTQTLSDTNVYVSNCLFRSITSGSHGGAIYCTSVTCLLVESTSFFSCKTSNYYGGAVYFYNTNSGQCVLYEVCGYDCCSTYTSGSSSLGQFSYVYVYSVASSKNYFNYSSISRCVTDYSNSWYTMRHLYGTICCPSVNISLNECQYRSGIICEPHGNSNSFICSLSYSSFVDNIANGYTCIMLWTTGAKHEVKYCNILRNTQGSLNSEGTIYACRDVMISNSCILENKATYIFRQGNSNYRITVSNCTIDLALNDGYLTTQNTVTKSFIHALNHMSTLNCHSEYDSAGTLTPIIQSPSPSKKQILCFTYGDYFYQSHLRIFFSLLSVFVYSFIHLDTSCNPLY